MSIVYCPTIFKIEDCSLALAIFIKGNNLERSKSWALLVNLLFRQVLYLTKIRFWIKINLALKTRFAGKWRNHE